MTATAIDSGDQEDRDRDSFPGPFGLTRAADADVERSAGDSDPAGRAAVAGFRPDRRRQGPGGHASRLLSMPTSAGPGSCSTRSPRWSCSNATTTGTGSPPWPMRSRSAASRPTWAGSRRHLRSAMGVEQSPAAGRGRPPRRHHPRRARRDTRARVLGDVRALQRQPRRPCRADDHRAHRGLERAARRPGRSSTSPAAAAWSRCRSPPSIRGHIPPCWTGPTSSNSQRTTSDGWVCTSAPASSRATCSRCRSAAPTT